MLDHSFVGCWQLVSFVAQDTSGQRVDLYGENPQGFIMYNPDGFMSVSIMRADRPNFAAGDGSDAEKVTAFQSHFSYCGRYTVDKNTVTHHVEVSTLPNWCGEDLVRFFLFADNRLTLDTVAPDDKATQPNIELIWERAR